MNNLEFIDLEIARTKSKYKEHIKFGQTAFAVKDEKRLQILQQIKSELEAWYVLKPDLEHTENSLGEHEIELKVFYTDADVELHDTKEKYYKLKKALEVPNNE